MEETKHNIFTKTFRKGAHLKGVAKYSHIYRKIITIAKLAQISLYQNISASKINITITKYSRVDNIKLSSTQQWVQLPENI